MFQKGKWWNQQRTLQLCQEKRNLQGQHCDCDNRTSVPCQMPEPVNLASILLLVWLVSWLAPLPLQASTLANSLSLIPIIIIRNPWCSWWKTCTRNPSFSHCLLVSHSLLPIKTYQIPSCSSTPSHWTTLVYKVVFARPGLQRYPGVGQGKNTGILPPGMMQPCHGWSSWSGNRTVRCWESVLLQAALVVPRLTNRAATSWMMQPGVIAVCQWPPSILMSMLGVATNRVRNYLTHPKVQSFSSMLGRPAINGWSAFAHTFCNFQSPFNVCLSAQSNHRVNIAMEKGRPCSSTGEALYKHGMQEKIISSSLLKCKKVMLHYAARCFMSFCIIMA